MPGKLLVPLAIAGMIGAGVYYGWIPDLRGASAQDRPLSSGVLRGTLRIIVTERGNLESVKTVDGVCELNGYQNKIIMLTPEGNKVQKGDVVVRFDGSEIEKNIAQQEIKSKQASSKIDTTKQEVEIARNKGESEIITAEVEFKLAELTLEKYQKGDYVAETEKIEGARGLKRKELNEAKNQLDQMIGLVKKGFKSASDLRTAQSNFDARELELKGIASELMVKQKFERVLKSTEFQSKVDSSRSKIAQAKATANASVSKSNSEYDSAKATFVIEDQQLKELLKQKEKTTIKADQSGIVAYANEAWYDSSRQIREGATVYSRQKIFSLPDMSQMQVKVSIHESQIKKIKPGQTAEIRVDAFPNIVIVGKVKTVSQLADSNRGWLSGGVKEYATVVSIETMPKDELRPGMNAEVKILAGELKDVLNAPVQSVAQHRGKYYAYVVTASGVARKEVKIGDANEYQAEIVEGLKEGDMVALDARSRLAIDFKDDKSDDEQKKPAPAQAAPAGK